MFLCFSEIGQGSALFWLVYLWLHTESKSGTCLPKPLILVRCPPPPSPAQSYLIPGHLALMRDYLKSVNMVPIRSAVVLCTHEYKPWQRGFIWLSKYGPITNIATMWTGKFKHETYANTAFLIASVRVHYADERGIKIKNNLRFALVMLQQHRSHSWNQHEWKLIISRGFSWQTQGVGKDWNTGTSAFCLSWILICQY